MYHAPEHTLHVPDAPRKALLLVAHPDDETIFAGGLMLARPEWEWHIICMTGVAERRAQFDRAVDDFRNCGVNITFTRNHEFIDRYRPGDRRLWLAALAKEDCVSWDIVLTHGARGEYGHHHHMWLNHIAHLLYENVWDFFAPRSPVLQLAKTRTMSVPTDARKASIFDGAYGAIARGLREFAPHLTDAQMSCEPEYFTQGVVGL